MKQKLNENKSFTKENFSNETYQDIESISCKFSQCNFSNSNLLNCDFIDCVFENCNFSLVKLKDTGFSNAHFFNTKMIGIDFSLCNGFLFSFYFEGCTIDYCTFWRKKLKKTHFKKCIIKESDFSEADLTESIFEECDLLNSVFFKSELKKVDFRSAVNFIIDPELNNIKNAKFSLLGVPGLLSKYGIHIEN